VDQQTLLPPDPNSYTSWAESEHKNNNDAQVIYEEITRPANATSGTNGNVDIEDSLDGLNEDTTEETGHSTSHDPFIQVR
jgi:hypothetical protein